ncbi:MAG: hypothetical protein WDN49_06700 [Acetobacteraceae bacterium]
MPIRPTSMRSTSSTTEEHSASFHDPGFEEAHAVRPDEAHAAGLGDVQDALLQPRAPLHWPRRTRS